MTPDGKLITSAGRDSTVLVWWVTVNCYCIDRFLCGLRKLSFIKISERCAKQCLKQIALLAHLRQTYRSGKETRDFCMLQGKMVIRMTSEVKDASGREPAKASLAFFLHRERLDK